MNQNNEEILKEMVKTTMNVCKGKLFTFADTEPPLFIKTRKPNSKEGKQWLISKLRLIYFQRDIEMKKSTYYSLKGEIRHWSLIPIFNYLRKRGYDEIEKGFEEYVNSESISEYRIPVKCQHPVKRCIIEIDTESIKGVNQNEQ